MINFGNTGHFAGGGTVGLLSSLPQITESVTIVGWLNPGATNNAIGVTGSPFVFGAGTSNNLQQLNIGGSITNGQSISISGCVITNGGIQSTGVLQIVSSSVFASPSAGIWSSGNATLNTVTVSGCSGGGIHNEGSMAVVNSLISSNTCTSDGVGVYSSYALQMTECSIVSNKATNGINGGGIYCTGIASLSGCSVTNNYAVIGGGIYAANNLTLVGCTVAFNSAQGQSASLSGPGGTGGGQGANGGYGGGGGGGWVLASGWYYVHTVLPPGAGGAFGGSGGIAWTGLTGHSMEAYPAVGGNGGGAGLGGGVYFAGDNLSITNCTFSKNAVSGGSGSNGGVSDASLNPWSVGGGGGGGAGLGGELWIQAGSAYLVNSTVVNNTTSGGGGGLPGKAGSALPGGAGTGVGGGLFDVNGSCHLLNTIVAQNTSTSSGSDVSGAISSQGYNFIGNSSGSSGWNPVTDYQNATPLSLGPLQNNAGPTLTCALLPGSLCILAGTSVGAPLTDQRGIIRPLGKCDIGAYQYTTLIQTIVTWTNPVPIVYSTPLSAMQLNATANAGGMFAYTPPSGTVLNAGSNQVLTAIFTPSDPTSYTGATNTVLITVLQTNQVINFPTIPPQTVNAPPILLSATASSGLPVSYSLISGDALLAGNLLSVGSTPGQVVVRASQAGNGNYLAAPDVDNSFLVVSGSKPSITTQPTNQTVDLGGSATFSVAATTSPLTYQWQFQSLNMPGETNQSLSLLRVKASQGGPYRVIVSNPIGSVTSLVAVLTVNVPTGAPNISAQPGNQIIRVGETAVLSVGATGNPVLKYQ